jgi:putative ABC transport system substrate-binding protein
LPQHAEELVKLRVAVIAVGSPPATIAVKSATSTIPIVFITADDPVKDGFVASFNRPGGNLTGVTVFTTGLELLHDLTPKAASAANPGQSAGCCKPRYDRDDAGGEQPWTWALISGGIN